MKPASFTILFVLIFTATGCESMKNIFKPKSGPVQSILPPTSNPTLEQLTTAINRNSMAIRNMTTDDATLTVPGVLWPVKSNIVFESPKRLRIRGGVSSLSGQELDFGSNDTLFWLWVRRLESKEMYYCRHDQFATCPVRQMVPIEPDWVLEALGMVEFKANEQHEGPFPVEGGNFLIVTRRQTAAGQFTKKTTIDGKTGLILRQEMYSPQNVLTALAISSDHRYDKPTGIRYAKRVEVQCQGAEGSLTIDLGNPTFNSLTPISSGLFTMPTFDGYKPVDICGPEFQQTHGTVPPTATVPYQAPVTVPPAASTYQPVPGAAVQTVVR